MSEKNSKTRTFKIKIALLFIAVIAIGYSAGIKYLNMPAGDGSRKVEFTLKSGWGSNRVISELYKKKVIKSRTAFKLLLRIRKKTDNLKKGLYVVNDGMTVDRIIEMLSSGRTKTVSFTIPEGYHNRQIGELLVEKGFFKTQKEFLEYASSRKLRERYKIPALTVEGYLFPDTYSVPVGYDKMSILSHMIDNFFDKTSGLKGFPADPEKRHRIVIVASIVEREARLKEERPVIAGIFLNRLEKNYPLESCATIQYLFKKPKRRIYYNYLKIESPYNTYLNKGLPPGPISNPGLHSIEATLNPEKTDYLFFVIKGDGSHKFSKSFGEHARAKKKYIGP
jgi:UPF0755 protein